MFAAIIFDALFEEYEIDEILGDPLNDFKAWNATRKIELEVKSDINQEYRCTVASAGVASNQLRTQYSDLTGALYLTLNEKGKINLIKKQIQELIDALPKKKFIINSYEFTTYRKAECLVAKELCEEQKIKISIANLPISEQLEMIYFEPNAQSDVAIMAPLRMAVGSSDPHVFINWVNSRVENVSASHEVIIERARFDPFLYFTIDSFESINASEFLAYGDIQGLPSPNLPKGYKGMVVAGIDGEGEISGLWFENNEWTQHKSNIHASDYLMEKFINFAT
jgi:hypothetical protein